VCACWLEEGVWVFREGMFEMSSAAANKSREVFGNARKGPPRGLRYAQVLRQLTPNAVSEVLPLG
jgi:hypothetical protein